MTSLNPAAEGALELDDDGTRGGWIESRAFDSTLLILVPLVTLPILMLFHMRMTLLAMIIVAALAFSHYFSTLAFFFWNENKAYYWSRWPAFYGGPALIIVVYFVLISLGIPYIIQFVLFFWNTFHVARQNCGILSIYRAQSEVGELRQRHAANRAIISVSVFLALWNIDTHEEVSALFSFISEDFGSFIRLIAGIAAAVAMADLAYALIRRKASLGLPEGLFLAASLIFFWPYLYISGSNAATAAMLLPHYVQYMALVWLLHRRKFGATGSGAPAPLIRMSSKLIVLIPVLAGVGLFIACARELSDRYGFEWQFETFYLLVAMLHFYMDGLIWSFRRPHIRQTILPFLLRRAVR